MLRKLVEFFKSPEPPTDLYAAIVAQARQKEFYAALGVPDETEGRFELLVFHLTLVMDRLQRGEDEDRDLGQRLFDFFFSDMDRSLREMGTGDLIVPKKIKKMAQEFYGHAEAYRAAIHDGDQAALSAAIARNIPASQPGTSDTLAAYAIASAEMFKDKDWRYFIAGNLDWPAIQAGARG